MYSSGYGSVVPKKGEVKGVPHELAELAKCTFSPNTQATRKQRAATQSSGYGKVLPPKPAPKPAEAAPFRPKTAIGATGRRLQAAAGSSGYGVVTAPAKRVPEPEMLPFKPKLTNSPRQAELRARAPAKAHLQARPRTAPAARRTADAEPLNALRHTLAADRGESDAPVPVDPGPGFVLDCSAVAASNRDPMRCAIPQPPALERTADAERLRANAASNYSGDYVPKQVLLEVRESEPVFKRVGALNSSYIASPEALPPVPQTATATELKSKVMTVGYGTDGYVPPQGSLPVVEQEPLWRPSTANPKPGLDGPLPAPPVNALTRQASSTGYMSQDYVPARGQKETDECAPPPLSPCHPWRARPPLCR